MKRDWDVIRDVLLEVEGLSDDDRQQFNYSEGEGDALKVAHALLLWKANFLEGMDVSTTMGTGLLSPELTWAGHDLLDTIRSKTVWDRIKAVAKDKGIELTFDAVKALGATALKWVVENGT